MGADQNRQTVVRLFEALSRHDLDAAGGLYADDAVTHLSGETFRWEQLKAMEKALIEAIPDLRLEVLDVVAAGDMAATRLRVAGTHEGVIPAGLLSPDALAGSGRSIDFEEGLFYRFDADARIVEEWAYFDMLQLLQQLGAIPEDVAG